MKHKLEMSLEQFAEAVAKENERLISGPGGIMEMKQTIADKEKRIEKMESQFKLYFHAFNKAAARIEKLEAALKPFSIFPIGIIGDEYTDMEVYQYHGGPRDPDDMEVYQCHGWPNDPSAVVTVADFRFAKKILEGKDE
jgi:hypothetical protein